MPVESIYTTTVGSFTTLDTPVTFYDAEVDSPLAMNGIYVVTILTGNMYQDETIVCQWGVDASYGAKYQSQSVGLPTDGVVFDFGPIVVPESALLYIEFKVTAGTVGSSSLVARLHRIHDDPPE